MIIIIVLINIVNLMKTRIFAERLFNVL